MKKIKVINILIIVALILIVTFIIVNSSIVNSRIDAFEKLKDRVTDLENNFKEIKEGFKNVNEGEVNYYKVEYKSNYDNSNVLNVEQKFEIVENVEKLYAIFNKIHNSKYSNLFSKDYFDDKNLLIFLGGIDSTINEIKINNNAIDVSLYYASPLSSNEEIHIYDLYLIPIDKGINICNINSTVYPDRLY